MERYVVVYSELAQQLAYARTAMIGLLQKLPFLSNVPASKLQWVFVAFVLVVFLAVVRQLIRWSITIALCAAVIAACLAVFFSYSFWTVLPMAGLGAAVYLLANKFQTS